MSWHMTTIPVTFLSLSQTGGGLQPVNRERAVESHQHRHAKQCPKNLGFNLHAWPLGIVLFSSSSVRTLWARVASVYGLGRNSTSPSSTPWCVIASSV